MPNTPKVVVDYKRMKEIEENCALIRETQIDRSLKFPKEFAPIGFLKQTGEHAYMALMNLVYSYGKPKGGDEVILWLGTKKDGKFTRLTGVGELFSVELEWSKEESIRLHLIAVEPNSQMVTSHYDIYDAGCAGLAYTVPKEAWENWRLWIKDVPEGIPFDKRMIYLALGDRSKIENMTLDEFAKLDFSVVRQLLNSRAPGQRMVRPTMEEACMTTEQSRPPPYPAPVIELNSSESSSPDSETQESPEAPKSGEKRKLFGSVITRGRLQKMKSSPRPRTPPPGTSRNLFFSKEKIDDLTPLQREGIQRLLEDCLAPSKAADFQRKKKSGEEFEGEARGEEENTMEEADELKEAETMSCPDDFSPNCSGMFEFSMTSASSGMGPDSTTGSDSSVMVLEERVFKYEMLYGPLPANDSVDVFLSRKINESSILDVSTAESDIEAKVGTASDKADATNLW